MSRNFFNACNIGLRRANRSGGTREGGSRLEGESQGVYIGIIYRSRAFIGDSRIDVKSSSDLRRRFAKATASLRPRNFGAGEGGGGSPARVCPHPLPHSRRCVYRRFDEFSNFPTKFGQIRPNERNVGRPKFMRGINSLRCALRRGLRAHLRTSAGGGGSRGRLGAAGGACVCVHRTRGGES